MTFLDAHAIGLFIALAMSAALLVISLPLVSVVRVVSVVPITPSRAERK